MSPVPDITLLPPGVPTDLTNCDREPIHIPSSIQPHGMLIAARSSDLRVIHVSANSLDFLGVSPAFLLDHTLPEILGPENVAAIEHALGLEQYFPTSILTFSFPVSGRARFDVLANRIGGMLCVELEFAFEERTLEFIATRMAKTIRDLQRVKTLGDLCALVPPLIRNLTGYDRVMVYRFDADGHGEVIGEAKDPEMEPFLGLHYPATDIPQQARRLYLLQRIRIIVDMGYRPVQVLGHPRLASGEPLDMTYCGLRSVSPIHVEYLENMGVGASLGISLIHKDELWGMVICHHRSKKRPTQEVRALCDSLGQLISLQIGTTIQTENDSQRAAAQERLSVLSAAIENQSCSEDASFTGESSVQHNSIGAALAGQAEALLSLVGADGALIHIGDQMRLIGSTPPLAETSALMSAFYPQLVDGLAASSEVGATFPQFANLVDAASGAFKVHFMNEPNDGILWLRGEVTMTVNWGGNPDEAKSLSASGEGSASSPTVESPNDGVRMSPRKSFALWKQVQRGRSLPWLPSEIEAARGLQRIVTRALLNRAEADLTRLSRFDPLTGLSSYLVLCERIETWQNSGTSSPASLLFLNLDDFNTVNDTFGREVGDDVLKEFSSRLRLQAGSTHLVARLGSDEFVIFCEDCDPRDAERLANSILHKFDEPIVAGGKAVRLSTSIGVAALGPADAAGTTYPLRTADSAMYIAKLKGGNQVVVVESSQHAKALRLEIAEDVAARQLASRELEAAYGQLNSVMNATSDSVMRIGPDWTILFGNRKALEVVDMKVGRNFWQCFPLLLGDPAEQHLRTSMEQRVHTRYEINYAPDGQWYRVHVFPEDGGIGIFFSNCTLEKNTLSQLETEQVLREKRIEALSHMAGGLAHEISNPLAIIHGRASDLMLLAQAETAVASTDVSKACESIVKTSDRAMRILRGLRGFAREASQNPKELASIYEIVDQSVEQQQDRLDQQKVAVRLVIQSDLPLLHCRETEVGQILTNLLNNALDEIVSAKCEERWISIDARSEEGQLAIEVSDSGPGIEEKLKPHLMEPFFTTKELGAGMGVGLSLSRAIAQDHGGTLTLCKDTRHTCFRLVLPLLPTTIEDMHDPAEQEREQTRDQSGEGVPVSSSLKQQS